MSASAALTIEQGLARVAAIVGQEHARLYGETIVAAKAES